MSLGAVARALLIVLVALIALDAVLAENPPAPRDASASAAEFSAMRALDFAHELLPAEAPHPTGSEENARVRERLVLAFTQLGVGAHVEVSDSCSPKGRCATVRNVVATLPGAREEAVLVSAHYDSVPAGPGVGDDLAGAASVLEIARALSATPASEGSRELSVVFLVTDGEELGLLGARAFVKESPEAASVRFAVNMDNRGDEGPAMMFETSAGNGALIQRLSRGARRPVATSLFYEVYKRMPNDTDFSVWKAHDIQGVNFAFISGAAHYHTKDDDFAHLDKATVQHEGETALAMVRAFQSAPPASRERDVIYFDVFGATLATCPEVLGLPLTLASFLVCALAALIRVRQEQTSMRALVLESLAWVLSLGWAIALSLPLARAFHGAVFGPHVTAQAFAFGLTGFAMTALALAFTRRFARAGISHGPWLAYLLVGVAVSARVPGASYLFFFPGVVAAGAEMVLALYAPREDSFMRFAVSMIPVAAAGVVWAPVFRGVSVALGLSLPLVFSVIAALACFPALSLARAPRSLFALTAASLAVSLALLAWS